MEVRERTVRDRVEIFYVHDAQIDIWVEYNLEDEPIALIVKVLEEKTGKELGSLYIPL